MQAIIPQNLKILNASVPESEAPLWDAGTTYAVGDKVIDEHYIYLALEESLDVKPSGNSDIADAPWRTLSVTNKYACIDLYNSTQTKAPEGATELVVQVPFIRPATAVGLLNMDAASVTVTLTTGDAFDDGTGLMAGGEVQWSSGEVSLLRDSASWWEYWFGRFVYTRDVTFRGIPPISGTLTVTLHGGRAAVGNILVGQHVIFGGTEYGVSSGFIDYSQTNVDGYGNEVWVKRRNAKRGSFPVYIHRNDIDYVHSVLSDLSGNPALWIGDDGVGFSSLIIYGFLREYDMGITNWDGNVANFEVRGIV